MKFSKLIILLFFTSTVFSQINYSTATKPFIEVTGTAETEIIPDEIYVTISLKERLEKGNKLTIQILEDELKKLLVKIRIPEKNLSISDVNAVLAKTGWWTEEVFSVANYSLKVNGADKLKLLFEGFKKLKIADVHITKATHSNILALRKMNRIKAIKAAKAKADYLLTAIGEHTGKPIKINEIATNNQPNYSYANQVNVTGYSVSKVRSLEKNKAVQFEKIKIASSIYVKFSIK
ncbi:SIMPL domain-containing protein [Polaribacter staleyi]|uniref:SIMPL domain-containing protein n=1 Tax=Polaribacter staleyi TaxID=2022337 RepID=UPI0031BB0DE9